MYQDREKEFRVKRRNSYEISVDTHTHTYAHSTHSSSSVFEWMNSVRLCIHFAVASSAKHFLIFIRCTKRMLCAFMTFYTMLNGHLSESEHHHHHPPHHRHLHLAHHTLLFYAFRSSKKRDMETAIYCQWKLPIGSNNHHRHNSDGSA